MKTCSFDGCETEVHARSLCPAHYQQQRRGMPLHAIDGAPVVRLCDFPDCGRVHYAYGLCEAHRDQQRRGRPLTPIQTRRPLGDKCLKCDLKPKARDLCEKHWGEAMRRRKGMKERGPIDPDQTLKSQSRVTSDKPKRNPKSDPSRNPKLPRGWDAVKVKTPAVRKQTSSNGDMSGDFGPVPPIDGKLAAAMRERLARRAALDLAEMLGVAS